MLLAYTLDHSVIRIFKPQSHDMFCCAIESLMHSIRPYNPHYYLLRPLHKTPCVSRHTQLKQEDFVGAKIYCPYVLADGKYLLSEQEEDASYHQRCHLHRPSRYCLIKTLTFLNTESLPTKFCSVILIKSMKHYLWIFPGLSLLNGPL